MDNQRWGQPSKMQIMVQDKLNTQMQIMVQDNKCK
jgi:hypothetical protein